jgi:RNA polymerase sigma-70 factor (ECF subfamily)
MSALATAVGPKRLSSGAKRPAHDADVGLMLRVRRDEPGAFTELIGRYWTQVFGRIYRQLGHRQEAEDLAQDVFLRLYRHRHRYEPRARFTTWLFHISQNVVRNALRSRRRHPCMRLDAVACPDAEPQRGEDALAGRWECPSRPIERAELARVVRAAVALLARRQRTALELHQFHDRTYNEIAAAMAMSPKAAKSLLYRARLELRACLTRYMEDGSGLMPAEVKEPSGRAAGLVPVVRSAGTSPAAR